jgi:hypothetical protein
VHVAGDTVALLLDGDDREFLLGAAQLRERLRLRVNAAISVPMERMIGGIVSGRRVRRLEGAVDEVHHERDARQCEHGDHGADVAAEAERGGDRDIGPQSGGRARAR